ncbi:hypothetical protein MKZ38_004670 [Zalerion maritima]|uniref:Uncharacterized protein n=1 Tax=Zalerion maritima TaxID=339359 RepID=A0AAD5RLV2_9PEZI|nr:hypothetical protein MKZ38_004670 [Zalerion maritima]
MPGSERPRRPALTPHFRRNGLRDSLRSARMQHNDEQTALISMNQYERDEEGQTYSPPSSSLINNEEPPTRVSSSLIDILGIICVAMMLLYLFWKLFLHFSSKDHADA